MSIIICTVPTFLEVYAKKLVQNVNKLVGWVRGKGFWDNAKTKQIIFFYLKVLPYQLSFNDIGRIYFVFVQKSSMLASFRIFWLDFLYLLYSNWMFPSSTCTPKYLSHFPSTRQRCCPLLTTSVLAWSHPEFTTTKSSFWNWTKYYAGNVGFHFWCYLENELCENCVVSKFLDVNAKIVVTISK